MSEKAKKITGMVKKADKLIENIMKDVKSFTKTAKEIFKDLKDMK